MLTLQDIQKLTEHLGNLFATKQEITGMENRILTEVRGYASLVEKTVNGLAKSEEEVIAHRQEHDDFKRRLLDIESVPAVAHELKSKSL